MASLGLLLIREVLYLPRSLYICSNMLCFLLVFLELAQELVPEVCAIFNKRGIPLALIVAPWYKLLFAHISKVETNTCSNSYA